MTNFMNNQELHNQLVKILDKYEYDIDNYIGTLKYIFTDDHSEMAEHLIKNNAVVLPCKLGDDIYLIPTYGGKPYCGVVKDTVQMIGMTSRGFHIKARNHHNHNKTYFLGKSAFLTKDEAEEQLRTMMEVKYDKT